MSDEPPAIADEYSHLDGTREVVFAVHGERVLTVREYPTVDRFDAAVENAPQKGTNETIAELSLEDVFPDEPDDITSG